VRKTSRPTTAPPGDEGMASTSMTATFTTTAPQPRVRIGRAWATCPCHAQDGCRTCQGTGVVSTPRLYTDDVDLTTYLTERTTW
jgi:hypothetical protein